MSLEGKIQERGAIKKDENTKDKRRRRSKKKQRKIQLQEYHVRKSDKLKVRGTHISINKKNISFSEGEG